MRKSEAGTSYSYCRLIKVKVNWNRWLYDLAQRKVNKYNEISYKAQKYSVPPGYSGLRNHKSKDVYKQANRIRNCVVLVHNWHILTQMEVVGTWDWGLYCY